MRWLPRHPTRAASAALLRLGRFRSADFRGARPLLRAPALANRPPPVASLHGPRRRSSTGWLQLAALAALDVRSHCCGTVAAPDSCKGYAPPCTPPATRWGCATGGSGCCCVPPLLRQLRHITSRYTQPGLGCALRRITQGYVQQQPPAALGTVAPGSSCCCQQRSGQQLPHLAAAALAGLLSAVHGSSRQQLPHLAAAALAAGS